MTTINEGIHNMVKVYQRQRTKISFHCQDEYFRNKLLSSMTIMNGSGKSSFVVIEIHPCWRSFLVKQLAHRNFRGRFSHWLLEMLKKGTFVARYMLANYSKRTYLNIYFITEKIHISI